MWARARISASRPAVRPPCLTNGRKTAAPFRRHQPDLRHPDPALSDDGALYSVTVTNPVNAVTSAQVRLTVNAARVPTIATQPTPVVAIPGQPATFTVVAAGSAPFHYQWMKDGAAIGGDSATFSIAAVQNSDAGSYSVTVTNLAGSVTSAAVTLKMAPPGVNLALNKVATASSYENQAGNPASNAVDGNATTKWGSAFVDPSWFEVDLARCRRLTASSCAGKPLLPRRTKSRFPTTTPTGPRFTARMRARVASRTLPSPPRKHVISACMARPAAPYTGIRCTSSRCTTAPIAAMPASVIR